MGACTYIWASSLCIAIYIRAARQHVCEASVSSCQQANRSVCPARRKHYPRANAIVRSRLRIPPSSIIWSKCFSAGIPTEAHALWPRSGHCALGTELGESRIAARDQPLARIVVMRQADQITLIEQIKLQVRIRLVPLQARLPLTCGHLVAARDCRIHKPYSGRILCAMGKSPWRLS
jgi:hypothetical protein